MTQILAAFIAIPYGLSVLMRGSDGLNRGTYSMREAGLLAAIGGALILTSLAMLMGVREAGLITAAALVIGLIAALRRKRILDGHLAPGEIAGRGLFAAFMIFLIAAGI